MKIAKKHTDRKLVTWDMKPIAWVEIGTYQVGGWFLIVRFPKWICISNWLTKKYGPITKQKMFILRTYGDIYDCAGIYAGTAWIGRDGMRFVS